MIKQSKNNKKNSKGHLPLWITLSVLLLVAILFFTLALPAIRRSNAERAAFEAPQMPYEVPGFTMLENVSGSTFDNGLQVLCVGRYSGAYLEDGSDEQIRDVLSIVVRNTTDSLIEYGCIEVPCGRNSSAVFEFSGLPARSSVLVQEKNRMTWSEKQKLSKALCTQIALPTDLVLDFDRDFKLYPSDGVINAENISDTDFTQDVSVFYKNFEFGLFMGGITYRARFSGGIRSGEIAQSLQKHYHSQTGAILYMSYGD